MRVRILTGDVLDILATLSDESVHCVVTSPPYWGLRDYGVEGQIGMEPTMGEHIAVMVAVFREVRRVMRKDGTCWLNYGASYVSGDTVTSQSRRPLNGPAYGSDDKAPEDSQDLDCAYPGPCDEHQADSQNHRDRISDIARLNGQSPPLGEPTSHDIERSDSSGASPSVSLLGVQASNIPASSRHDPDASDREATASASQMSRQSSSDDVSQSADTAANTIDIDEIRRLLTAHNWDKEPLALACLYLSIASRKWKAKDLANVPNLIAEALQCDGWWVRSEIIWNKPNPMPESVTDRPATAHEKIWLLTKSARYFYNAEAVRRELSDVSLSQIECFQRSGEKTEQKPKAFDVSRNDGGGRLAAKGRGSRGAAMNPSGANLRNVWTIPTKGFSGAHYATFPPDLIVPCIKAGTSEKGCCAECGAPWVRGVDVKYQNGGGGGPQGKIGDGNRDPAQRRDLPTERKTRLSQTTGWSPSCACDADTVPCTVLDPFIGSGTTAMVADRLGRSCIGIDLNPANVGMATERIVQDAGMFAEVS